MNKTKAPVSQETIVLDHLKRVGHITGLEAQGVHRIRSLSRRISELQKRGHAIHKETCYDVNGQRYTRYTLAQSNLKVGCTVEVVTKIDHDLAGNYVYGVGARGTVERIDVDGTCRVLFTSGDYDGSPLPTAWWANIDDVRVVPS